MEGVRRRRWAAGGWTGRLVWSTGESRCCPAERRGGTKSLCEEQLGSRHLLTSYLVGVTLKNISSSASLLAYFHEVFTTSVFFLYSKGLSPPYRFYTFLYKEQKKKNVLKCSCSFLQSLVSVRVQRDGGGARNRAPLCVRGRRLLRQVVAWSDVHVWNLQSH